MKSIQIGVLGASGYTGSEIVRLLANHPYFGISVMTADRKAGQSIASVFPHLITQDLPNLVAVSDADFSKVDAVFCCLPHGTTQDIIKALPGSLKVVDLSADFRLRDTAEYEEWYGQPHRAPELQKEAVYGLTEILRQEIQNARLVANPGCYPTSIQLPLVPLLKRSLPPASSSTVSENAATQGVAVAQKSLVEHCSVALEAEKKSEEDVEDNVTRLEGRKQIRAMTARRQASQNPSFVNLKGEQNQDSGGKGVRIPANQVHEGHEDFGDGFKGGGQGNFAGECGGGFRGLAGGVHNEFEGGVDGEGNLLVSQMVTREKSRRGVPTVADQGWPRDSPSPMVAERGGEFSSVCSGGGVLGRSGPVLAHSRVGLEIDVTKAEIQLLIINHLEDKANLIEYSNIIIDAKSGVSGAGRGAKEANLYTEVAEGIHAYGVTRHRHVPEIEQGLSDVAESKVTVSFTPHLMPMSRGMQSTIYVQMTSGVTVDDLYEQLKHFSENEEFVFLLEKGVVPHTRNVRGSNYCYMNVFPDRIPGRAIIISVIDNLVKGASGQAIQNLNLMMGYPENTGLLYQPLFP
uniref:Probable N-acetyl-gamma-glutamyl-phosphate reductase, chloroplastic n=1 Tax=Chenopodium quinoa TaxID=63459 RepID=A0A803MVD8_CHEQI